jgi:hypothetical protein
MLGLSVTTEPTKICRGEILKVLMNVNPTKTVEVPEIIIRVECIRRSEYTDSRGRKRYEYDTMAKSEVFIEGMTLYAGQPRTIEGHIAVPTDGVPSNPYGTLTVRWYLTVGFMLPTFAAEKKLELQVVDQSLKKTQSKYIPPVQKEEVSHVPIAPDKPVFKLCISCGGKNDSHVRFCTECGAELG